MSSMFLVPLPSICQNLIPENTGLTKMRLQTSGMSTPVSNTPTERAIRGSESSLNLAISSVYLYISETMI